MRLHLDSSAIQQNGLNQTAQAALTSGSGTNQLPQGSRTDDSVQISGPAALLSQLSADRASRIQQLTVAVQVGSYQPSSLSISRAIVGNSLG